MKKIGIYILAIMVGTGVGVLFRWLFLDEMSIRMVISTLCSTSVGVSVVAWLNRKKKLQ